MMKPDSKGSIFLESKKDMKARGLASPDAADAIALTFSYPVANRGDYNRPERRTVSERGMVSTGWMGA
jgi:phage terminase large subunit